jgi:glycosyltransferase involved in cell wall biosynthesis
MGVKVLAASYAYPPLRYPRAIQVARLLAQLPASEVTVLCAQENGNEDVSLGKAYADDELRVVRVPWSRRASLQRRLRNRILEDNLLVPDRWRPWQRDAARTVRRLGLLRRGDVVVTFGQPMSDHLLGIRLARAAGAAWIAHFSDPWVDSVFRNSGRVTRAFNARLEAQVVAQADGLVFTSQETVDLVLRRHSTSARAKVHVLPHAHDPRLYPDEAPDVGAIVVRYVGNFYGRRGPEPLLDALRLVTTRRPGALKGVHFELVGSQERPLSDAALSGLPPELVSIRPAVPYLESLALMKRSRLLLVLDAPGDTSVFLPSKLIDYLGARRPILALTPPGAASSLVERAGGWHADPADPAASAEAIIAALAAVRSSPEEHWGRQELVDEYSAETVGANFRTILKHVAGGIRATR